MKFYKKNQFLIFLKKMNVRKAIFFLGISDMPLANKIKQKTAKTRHVAYFLAKTILSKTLRLKNRLNLE